MIIEYHSIRTENIIGEILILEPKYAGALSHLRREHLIYLLMHLIVHF